MKYCKHYFRDFPTQPRPQKRKDALRTRLVPTLKSNVLSYARIELWPNIKNGIVTTKLFLEIIFDNRKVTALYRNAVKILLAEHSYLSSRTKVLEQGKEIEQNWTGLENIDIWFCVLFGYCQSLIFRSETGLWTISPPKLEIFLTLTNFLRS